MRPAPPIGDRARVLPDAGLGPVPLAISAMDGFVTLSAALTGFNRAELYATGMVDTYFGVMLSTLGDAMMGRLFTTWSVIAGYEPRLRDVYIELTILGNNTLGPVARNLVMLWYLGQWAQLPREWRDANGANTMDNDRIISAEAYRESLVWVTFGGHPQGAKAPGYASWAVEPSRLEHA
jgi:hypothetical protein